MTETVTNVIPSSNVKAIIIYGKGRHFSSGASIDDLLMRAKNETTINDSGNIIHYPPFLLENVKSFQFFNNLDIPVIAAIRGICLGSAFELALSCHIRICGNDSVLGLPETSFNLIPGCGGIQKMLSLAKLPCAMELILSGRNFSEKEALEWNIIDCIVPKKNLIDHAVKLAENISNNYNRGKIKNYILDLATT